MNYSGGIVSDREAKKLVSAASREVILRAELHTIKIASDTFALFFRQTLK
jgi:hypothetical protein